MDPSAWIALASLAGFVILQTVVASFALGGLFQRVKQVEARPQQDNDCKAELAVLNSKFAAMTDTVKEMSDDVKNLLLGQTPAARRRGADG